jgi:GNAT superfamily N-acetyltransferase
MVNEIGERQRTRRERTQPQPAEAKTTEPKTTGRRSAAALRPSTRLLLDALAAAPAFMLGRRTDVVAWNPLAAAVHGFAPDAERNFARRIFLDPASRDFHRDWEAVAAETVAWLRLDADRYPSDQLLASLVGELSIRSETFGRLWVAPESRRRSHGTRLIAHPLAGDLDLGYETLALPDDQDLLLVTYLVEPGSASAERLQLLSNWNVADETSSAALANNVTELRRPRRP